MQVKPCQRWSVGVEREKDQDRLQAGLGGGASSVMRVELLQLQGMGAACGPSPGVEAILHVGQAAADAHLGAVDTQSGVIGCLAWPQPGNQAPLAVGDRPSPMACVHMHILHSASRVLPRCTSRTLPGLLKCSIANGLWNQVCLFFWVGGPACGGHLKMSSSCGQTAQMTSSCGFSMVADKPKCRCVQVKLVGVAVR